MARVLVADDAAFVRKVVSEMLVHGGHEPVGEAGTGADTVELYRRLRPDVAIIDVNMPGGDGYSAASEILAHDPAACIVMASVYPDASLLVEARVPGTVDFLVKPFELRSLLGAVERACTTVSSGADPPPPRRDASRSSG
ncbi:MAG TPA: response regulator [Gaiellaceae bacterium]|nr:response regulator [Gaiellaceae bacterium]